MKHFFISIQTQRLRNTFCVKLLNNDIVFFLTFMFHIEVLNVKTLHLHAPHLRSLLLALIILLIFPVVDSNEIARRILSYSLQQGLIFLDDLLVFIFEEAILVLKSFYFLDGLC